MARAYTKITFTPEVMEAQRYWDTSARTAPALAPGAEPQDALTAHAAAFVAEVNTAFIATINSNGWPYVQHRGGARGFIKLVSARRILIPDHDGNGQLLTAGNLSTNSKAMLLLMDYSAGRRLKLWGRAKMLETAGMASPEGVSASPRMLVFDVEAMNFNCSSFIPRLVDESR
jgi:uncharacterized protein